MEETKLSFFSTEENQAWQEIPGWLLPSTAEELYRCASLANPNGFVVEIGSFSGKSTVCIASALKKNRHENKMPQMAAIDIMFQPGFRDYLALFGVSDYINVIKKPSLAAAEKWNQPISFIYIDGHHGKAHAYADLMVWDTFIMPGGIVALDDTAGFFLGPSLQVQAAIQTGAYDLISDIGGVTFLKKKKALLPFISDFPLSEGSLRAYVDYVSAWLGAMDLAFELPQLPPPSQNKIPPKQNKDFVKIIGRKVLDTSLRQILHSITKKKASRKQINQTQTPSSIDHTDEALSIPNKLKKPYQILKWLEVEHQNDEVIENTVLYLNACLEIRLNHIANAIKKLEILSELDESLKFINYNISIQQLSVLRLAQSHDLQGNRDIAKEKYQVLIKESTVPEIRHQAELGLSKSFQLSATNRNKLLREYNAELRKYKTMYEV
ncbi:MAG: class I SAM-dependent methyltransferase [Okeania sp. SIO3H1]|uniref:class I SAM-dependent methyltransferase n=1 Tax=Okeania sp. SIO1I7 TaxID=2607772 RepID=UPI0013C82A03|nr:class I SAM-dependent methyltransferase [Okeania sp. SIO1I7]NEN89301.1 class I SAM-dependent methyltransferase [Okeania sp. SIO3H1]NET27778.1 class I SAM-dependent methyltransferase [Okeania sp. SIO1I7]